MEKIQRDKFRRSEPLRKLLTETGTRELAWGNAEGETFWGVVKGASGWEGQNQLGRILMDIRRGIQDGTELDKFLQVNCELETDALRRPPMELVEEKIDQHGEVKKKVHQLRGHASFKLGRLPTCTVVAAHESVAGEHAILLHTRAKAAQLAGGLAVVDLASGSGVWVGDRRVPLPWAMEPVGNGVSIRLGDSSRTYTLKATFLNSFAVTDDDDNAVEPPPKPAGEGIRILQTDPGPIGPIKVVASKSRAPGSSSPDRARRRDRSRSPRKKDRKGREYVETGGSRAIMRETLRMGSLDSDPKGRGSRRRSSSSGSRRMSSVRLRRCSQGSRSSRRSGSSSSSDSKARRRKQALKKLKRK